MQIFSPTVLKLQFLLDNLNKWKSGALDKGEWPDPPAWKFPSNFCGTLGCWSCPLNSPPSKTISGHCIAHLIASHSCYEREIGFNLGIAVLEVVRAISLIDGIIESLTESPNTQE